MSEVVTTKHAKQRMKERCGLDKKSANRIAKIAYEKGLKHGDLTGNLKKWVDGLYFYNKTANQIRIHGDKSYLFHDDKLITVLQIPHNLMKDVERCKKNEKQGE